MNVPPSRYQCTAADIATTDVDSTTPGTTVGKAREWLTENGYDFAPVLEDETPSGYVDRTDLADVPGDQSVGDHVKTITLDETIEGDAAFEEVLEALYESRFFFLGGRNRISGILTRADLNKSPAYIHLFERISLLEEHFRDLVSEHAPNWKDDVPIDVDTIEKIECRHDSAKEANIELDEIHYAQFSTLVRIVAYVEPCWRACGFSSADRASSQLDDLRRLRNAVAHSNLLIENTDEGLLEKGRTIGKLEQTHRTLVSCLDALD